MKKNDSLYRRLLVFGCFACMISLQSSAQSNASKYAFYFNLEPLDMVVTKNVEDGVESPGNTFDYKSKLTFNGSIDFMRKVGEKSSLGLGMGTSSYSSTFTMDYDLPISATTSSRIHNERTFKTFKLGIDAVYKLNVRKFVLTLKQGIYNSVTQKFTPLNVDQEFAFTQGNETSSQSMSYELLERTYEVQGAFWQARSYIGVQYAATSNIDIGVQCKIQKWIGYEGQLLYRFKFNADLNPATGDTFTPINNIWIYEPTATVGVMLTYRFDNASHATTSGRRIFR